jgi:hypothetical protein
MFVSLGWLGSGLGWLKYFFGDGVALDFAGARENAVHAQHAE